MINRRDALKLAAAFVGTASAPFAATPEGATTLLDRPATDSAPVVPSAEERLVSHRS